MNTARFFVVGFLTLAPLLFSGAPQADQHTLSQHSSLLVDSTSVLVQKVREATLPFLDVREADRAGYGQFLGCISGPQEGAMGVHFVNPGLVGDKVLDANRPEALIYEFKGGVARLVGVEFIVMAEDWHQAHRDPPVLEGQTFQYNGSPNRYGLPGFYELHVWAWRDNPHGAFVDWNTEVTCEGQ